MRGCVYQRRRGSPWTAQIEDDRDPITEKRRRIYLGGYRTRREAEAALAEAITNRERGVDLDPTKLTVTNLLDRWLAAQKHRVAARTWEQYHSIVELRLKPTLGAIALTKLRAPHVEQALASWIDGERLDRHQGPLSSKTIHHCFTALRTALRQGLAWQLLHRDPLAGVKPPKVAQDEVATLDLAGCAALLAAARGTNLEAAITVALGSGLRRGELLGLTWADVDLDAGRLWVRRSLEYVNGASRTKEPKTERSRRVIALPAFVVEALRRHKSEQFERLAYLTSEIEARRMQRECPIIDDGEGRWLKPVVLTSRYRRFAAGVKSVPRVKFHALRHSYATLALEAGVSLDVISRALGHSTLGTTSNLYVHRVEALQQDAADRLDRSLGEALAKHLGTAR